MRNFRLKGCIKYMRGIAVVFLVIASFAQWLLIRDLDIALEFSSSFCWLMPDQSEFAFYLSIALCVLAAILATTSAIADRSARLFSLLLLVFSIALVPLALIYAQHIANTTIPAVLQK